LKTTGSHRPTWITYSKRFREDAHQLLAWGYAGAVARIKPDHEETVITCFITDAIELRLNASFAVTPRRFSRYSVKTDNPVQGEGREGKARRRLDIFIELTTQRPRPRYIFEAKRLSSGNHPITNYTDGDGLLRFAESTYASDCPEAALVGYVQSDDLAYWEKKLKNRMDLRRRELHVKRKLSKCMVLSSLPNEWTSTHARLGSGSIILYHIFLDCREGVSSS